MSTAPAAAPIAPSAPAAAPAAAAPTAPVTPSASSTVAAANAPAPTPAAPSASPTPSPTDWTSGMKDELKGFITNKGWKGPEDAIGSYQNLEKLIGAPQDKIIKLPDAEDAEGWNSVYAKLGRPQTPADYKIEAAKEGGDPAFAKWASERFHELGLNTKQGQSLVEKFNEYSVGLKSAQEQSQIQLLKQGQEAVQKEWGAAFDQNVKVAARAASQLGVDKGLMDKIESAIGYDGVMKLFHKIGAKTGESSFVQGEISGGALTPQAANDQIQALRQDQNFTKSLLAGDATAKAKWNRLHEMANPGEHAL